MSITNMFRKKVKNDVDLIKKEARVVVLIGAENKISVFHNSAARINVIGIIGSGKTLNGYYFQEALLEEIGISRSHPYRKGKVPEALWESGRPKAITYRYSGFSLSKSQYLAVAPMVFNVIQQLADERVAGWRSGTPDNKFYVPGAKCRYNKSRERVEYHSAKNGMVETDSGARFSVSLEGFFARDIFWTGMIAVEKFARLINLRLEHRLERKRGKKRGFKPRAGKSIDELYRFSEVRQMIAKSAFPKWLIPNVVLYLPGGDNNKFAFYLRQTLEWQEKITPEWEMALKAFPGQKARTNDMRLKLKSLNKKGKGYVVFEVLPSQQWRKYVVDQDDCLDSPPALAEELASEKLDALPF